MPALNHKGSFGLVKEATWGVDPGSGYEFTPFQSESMKVMQDFIFVKAVRGSRQGSSRKVAGARTAGGAYTFETNVEEHIGLLLYSALGGQATVDHGAGNGGTHTFTPSETIPAGLSALINRDETPDADNVWSYTGGRVRKLSLEAAEGQLLKVTADISFQNGAPGATPVSPTYSTENPLVYHAGTFTVDTVAVAIKGFKLDIDTGLLDKRGKLGTDTIQQQQPGIFSITGEIEAYFDNMDLVTKYLNGADSALVLHFDGTPIGMSQRELTITIPVAQFTGEVPNISGPDGEIMLKLPFTAYQPAPGTDIMNVTVTNSKRTDY